ncbi:hypothetical protein FKP32DRAFT_252413 [Trametes sanguinea]|nr:hypothetical protein FKP32DRAFT_252413 [Trametes sanguinea]
MYAVRCVPTSLIDEAAGSSTVKYDNEAYRGRASGPKMKISCKLFVGRNLSLLKGFWYVPSLLITRFFGLCCWGRALLCVQSLLVLILGIAGFSVRHKPHWAGSLSGLISLPTAGAGDSW